jgi:hypothetical protein
MVPLKTATAVECGLIRIQIETSVRHNKTKRNHKGFSQLGMTKFEVTCCRSWTKKFNGDYKIDLQLVGCVLTSSSSSSRILVLTSTYRRQVAAQTLF